MRAKRTDEGVRALPECVVRVCLLGWGAPDATPQTREDDSQLFDLWSGGTAAVAATWRVHGAFLEAEATRLGITPRRGWWRDGRTV